MADLHAVLLGLCIFAAAALYSSVGHAGASGYLAAMAFFGVHPEVMKPTALVLNILVASIATARFYRAGCFSWAALLPFAVTSVPFSFLGGALRLPERVYRPVVGAILLLAATRLLSGRRGEEAARPPRIPVPGAAALGAVIGLLSGLTGTGGGVFLSPLLLLAGWGETRRSAGVTAAFILVNSAAGLTGHLAGVRFLPPALPLWMAAAGLGGLVGTELGSRRLAPRTLRALLALVLAVAGLKLVLG